MALTVAVQMDPIQAIRIAGDPTFALRLEAQARGHRLLHYPPDRLSMQGRASGSCGQHAHAAASFIRNGTMGDGMGVGA